MRVQRQHLHVQVADFGVRGLAHVRLAVDPQRLDLVLGPNAV